MPLIDEADIKSSCIIFLALAYQHFSLEGVIKFDLLEGWTVTMDLDGSPQAPPSAIRKYSTCACTSMGLCHRWTDLPPSAYFYQKLPTRGPQTPKRATTMVMVWGIVGYLTTNVLLYVVNTLVNTDAVDTKIVVRPLIPCKPYHCHIMSITVASETCTSKRSFQKSELPLGLHFSCAMCPFRAVVLVNSAPHLGQYDLVALPDFSR